MLVHVGNRRDGVVVAIFPAKTSQYGSKLIRNCCEELNAAGKPSEDFEEEDQGRIGRHWLAATSFCQYHSSRQPCRIAAGSISQ